MTHPSVPVDPYRLCEIAMRRCRRGLSIESVKEAAVRRPGCSSFRLPQTSIVADQVARSACSGASPWPRSRQGRSQCPIIRLLRRQGMSTKTCPQTTTGHNARRRCRLNPTMEDGWRSLGSGRCQEAPSRDSRAGGCFAAGRTHGIGGRVRHCRSCSTLSSPVCGDSRRCLHDRVTVHEAWETVDALKRHDRGRPR